MGLQNRFIHHVYFWLKKPDSKEDLQALIAGLESLSKIAEIQLFHIGVPAATDREVIDASYAVSWLTVFETAKDQDVYQEHPLHLKFIADCSHLWSRVKVYDSIQHL
ncbi:MAG: Dabb family protein [Bacteroidota bacterium]